MKFIKHIFTGWLIVYTLLFNAGLVYYFYELFFNPESFYEGVAVIGTIAVLGIYTIYMLYCIKTFKGK